MKPDVATDLKSACLGCLQRLQPLFAWKFLDTNNTCSEIDQFFTRKLSMPYLVLISKQKITIMNVSEAQYSRKKALSRLIKLYCMLLPCALYICPLFDM